MITRNIFCFLLLLIFTSIYAVEENSEDYDFGERSVLINSYDLSVDEKQNLHNDEVQKKIDFLKGNGYSQVKNPPSFFADEIYRIIYGSNIGWDEGFKRTSFSKDGMMFTLTYARYKPSDPNFYVAVTFEAENERYWFLKINYLLEYFRTEEWLNIETGVISVEKIFY